MADDDGWRFSVDEVGPDDDGDGEAARGPDDGEDGDEGDRFVTMVGEDDDGPTVGIATGDAQADADADPDADGGGNVAGTLAPDATVEPGSPELESVVFVTAGAILTVLVFAGIVPLDPATMAALAGVVAGGAALLYVCFRRF